MWREDTKKGVLAPRNSVGAAIMFQFLAQLVLVLAGSLGGYLASKVVDLESQAPGLSSSYVIFLFVILGGAIGFVFGGIVGREITAAWQILFKRLSELSLLDLVLATVGLVIGLIVAFFSSQPLRLMTSSLLSGSIMVLLIIVCAYIGVSVAMPRRRELAMWFPQLAPANLRGHDERSLLLDTSAVIDGRFRDLSKAGFVTGRLKVPRFVLAELQTLADSADDGRRARGRRGLDLLSALPDTVRVDVIEIDYPDIVGVDDKLMQLAGDTSALIVTVDYNLTKVARVRSIDVLNLNEAAEALRPNLLPGDTLEIRVVKPGKENGQGVGYLEDGTMVVVQEGRDLVGTAASIEVTSVLQTSAGRMVFAKPADGAA